MKIDRTKQIPEGSIARIFRKSAIGEPYIDFQPPASYTGVNVQYIKHGEQIPQSRTTVPLEFSDLLRSAGALVSSIDPDKAGSLVHELSLALDGRGQALRDLTTALRLDHRHPGRPHRCPRPAGREQHRASPRCWPTTG